MENEKEKLDLTKLKDPFPQGELEFKPGATTSDEKKCLAMPYITSRAIMTRLDEICGPENWKVEFKEWREKGCYCTISIRINGEWIPKSDGADETNFEATKGGFSGALKRAAVQWGIGRYLYYLPAQWLACEKKGKRIIIKEDPKIPEWALPGGSGMPAEPTRGPNGYGGEEPPEEKHSTAQKRGLEAWIGECMFDRGHVKMWLHEKGHMIGKMSLNNVKRNVTAWILGNPEQAADKFNNWYTKAKAEGKIDDDIPF